MCVLGLSLTPGASWQFQSLRFLQFYGNSRLRPKYIVKLFYVSSTFDKPINEKHLCNHIDGHNTMTLFRSQWKKMVITLIW